MISVKSGGGASRQEKTVTANTSQIEITPDRGKLFSKVLVNPTPTQSKNINPTYEKQIVHPDTGYHLKEVVVNPVKIDISNGKETMAICLEDIPINSFVSKVKANAEKMIIGRLWNLDAHSIRLKHIKGDYYILISKYGNSFYANLVYIPVNGPVTSGVNVYVWDSTDLVSSVDICINDENSFVLACDSSKSCAIKYYTVDYNSMTVIQKSVINDNDSGFVSSLGIIKISKNRFMCNFSRTLKVFVLSGQTLTNELSIEVPNSDIYSCCYPIYVRDNEALLVSHVDDGFIRFIPVKYSNGSLVFGTLINSGSYGDDSAEYPYEQIASINPKQFDVLLNTKLAIHAVNVRNNVVTILNRDRLDYIDIYPSMILSGEDITYLNTEEYLYKYKLSGSHPYITLESKEKSYSNTGCAVGRNMHSGIDVMFRVGSDSNFEQMVTYTGTKDIISPGRIENIYGIAAASGSAGEEIPCIVLDI